MLLGAEELTGGFTKFDWQKPVAVVLGVLLLVEIAVVTFFGCIAESKQSVIDEH